MAAIGQRKFQSNVSIPRRPPAPSRRPGAMGDLISDRWWCNKRITDRQRLDAIKRATKVRHCISDRGMHALAPGRCTALGWVSRVYRDADRPRMRATGAHTMDTGAPGSHGLKHGAAGRSARGPHAAARRHQEGHQEGHCMAAQSSSPMYRDITRAASRRARRHERLDLDQMVE